MENIGVGPPNEKQISSWLCVKLILIKSCQKKDGVKNTRLLLFSDYIHNPPKQH